MRRMIMCLKRGAAELRKAIREIAFVDYYSTARLQQAFSDLPSEKGTFKKGDIDAIYERRRAFIGLWYHSIPLFFCFVPLWLYLVYPIFQGQLSSLQSVVIIASVAATGICYLLTFYRDGLHYQLRLVQIREGLLAGSVNQVLPALATPKGGIPLLLLQELIKKEAKQPSIFDTDIDQAQLQKKQDHFDIGVINYSRFLWTGRHILMIFFYKT